MPTPMKTMKEMNKPSCGLLLSMVGAVILICLVGHINADVKNCKNGDIDPQNPYFLENESISLECVKNGQGPADLKFMKSNKILDSQYVHKVNYSAIQLQLPPLTTEDLNQSELSTHILCLDGNQCLKSIHVVMEYYPRVPQDVRCYGYNWQQMDCSWLLGVQYKDPHNTQVFCEVAYDNSLDTYVDESNFKNLQWHDCPNLIDNTCEWKGDDFKGTWRVYLRISVLNRLRNISVSTQIVHFLYDTINEPAAVKPSKISVGKVDNSCVHVKWRPHSKARNLMFRLSYTSECSVNKVKMIPYIRKYSEKLKNHVRAKICKLHPHNNYTISISSRYINSSNIQTGHWSQETHMTFMTESKVPRKSPDTVEGLYDHISDTDKNLTVYWKPLEVCDLHSDSVTYSIQSELDEDKEAGSSFVSHLSIGSLPTNVTIQAWNKVGKATTASQMRVFPSSFGPTPSELIVEHNIEGGQQQMILTVNRLNNTQVSNVLVWCKGSDYCQEPVQWMTVTESKILLQVEDITRFGLITYGYRDSQTVNTGIVWEKCSYKEGKNPSTPVLKQYQMEIQPEKGLRVDWLPIDCSKWETGYVKFYELNYCRVDLLKAKSCEGKEATVQVPRQETSYTLKGLKDGSLYMVWLKAVGLKGLTQKSEHKVFKVIEKGQNKWIIVAIGMISGISVIAVVLLIVYCCCKCQKRIKSNQISRDILGDILPAQDASNMNSKLLGSTPDGSSGTHSSPDSGTSSINSNATVVTFEKDPLLSNFDSDSAINMNTDIYDKPDAMTSVGVARLSEATPTQISGLLNDSGSLLQNYNRPSDISCGITSTISLDDIYDTINDDGDDGEEGETEFNGDSRNTDSHVIKDIETNLNGNTDSCVKDKRVKESTGNTESCVKDNESIANAESCVREEMETELNGSTESCACTGLSASIKHCLCEDSSIMSQEHAEQHQTRSEKEEEDLGIDDKEDQKMAVDDENVICDSNHPTTIDIPHNHSQEMPVNHNLDCGSDSLLQNHKESFDLSFSEAESSDGNETEILTSDNLVGYIHNNDFDIDTVSINLSDLEDDTAEDNGNACDTKQDAVDDGKNVEVERTTINGDGEEEGIVRGVDKPVSLKQDKTDSKNVISVKSDKNQTSDEAAIRDKLAVHDIVEQIQDSSESSGDYQMVTVNSGSTIGSTAGWSGLDNPVFC